jgi:hypothetical protein
MTIFWVMSIACGTTTATTKAEADPLRDDNKKSQGNHKRQRHEMKKPRLIGKIFEIVEKQIPPLPPRLRSGFGRNDELVAMTWTQDGRG